MCAECYAIVSRFYPQATEAERVDILWNETPFPFGQPSQIEEALRKLAEQKR
jgi:hypothetical protein